MPVRPYKKAEPMRSAAPDPNNKHPTQAKIIWSLSTPRYCMDDVVLNHLTRSKIEDAVSYYENKEILFNKWGLRERYADHEGLSINLYGPPGTGKTMTAHAIADQLALPMICVDYAEIESKFVGETSKNLSSLFKKATEENAVIFFDEADALLSKRVTNMTSATDVSVNQTRSVLLNLLNFYTGVIIFSTNFIQNFDAAFLRRIKYHIQFEMPDLECREQLWRLYIPNKLPHDLCIPEISKKYDNITGSDISSAVFSAAVSAAHHQENYVRSQRFEDALQSIISVKAANAGNAPSISTRRISEEEVRTKLGQEMDL